MAHDTQYPLTGGLFSRSPKNIEHTCRHVMEKVGLLDLSRFAKTRIDKNIALGYVPPNLAAPGTRLEVEVLGKKLAEKVVSML